MPQPFDIDPFGFSPGKPGFPMSLKERLIARKFAEVQSPKRAPLPSPSLVEPLNPPGVFGVPGERLPKTGFQPFQFPSSSQDTLYNLFMRLLYGGQFRI